MRGAVSSGVFPIFGDSSSSSSGGSWSFGSPDSSRPNWSCSKSRSSDSKAVYLSRDEGSTHSQGVRGTSCPCSPCVECTCSQSSDSCSTGAKVTRAVHFSVVVVVAGGSSGSGHWMTSVADEGHLDQLAETSQRRSSQEIWCLCKEIFWCLSWKFMYVHALLFFVFFCYNLLSFMFLCKSTLLGSVCHSCALSSDDEKLCVL